MPVTPPPTYVTNLPNAQPPRAPLQDSLLVTHRRRQRGHEAPVVAPQRDIEQVPRAPRPPEVVVPIAAAVLPPVQALPPRLPAFEPTHMVHQGLPAVNERQRQSDFVRALRRVTLTEPNYTPEEKADKIIDWMVANKFMVQPVIGKHASQRPAKFYGHDVATSKLFASDGVFIRTNMPWLKTEQVDAIRALLIDRIHAFKADPNLARPSTRDCLVRYFKGIKDKEPLQPVTEVNAVGGKQKLTRLRALHMDDVYFDAKRPLEGGNQGSFHAGITSKGYPVAIKLIKKDAKKEAETMRLLTVGGYLQAHYSKPPLVVMPCYSGTFKDFSSKFYGVPTPLRRGDSGGLIGARYMAGKLLVELDYLHNEMHGLHLDIKGSNIFVSKAQKLFVLGDFGISAVQSDRGDSRQTGHTMGYSSPEQLEHWSRPTAASDIFSLMTTLCNGLLCFDPAVDRMWRRMHPGVIKPSSLFPHEDETIALAFIAWSDFNSSQPSQAASFAEFTAQAEVPEIATFGQMYRQIDKVMRALDEPFWADMRAGLRMDPKKRPSARALRGSVTLNKADRAQCERIWDAIQPYNSAITAELTRLEGLVPPHKS